MAEFQYRVITPEGKEKKGTMEGKSVEQVTGVLKAQKNVILSVSEASLMNRDINFSLGGRVSARDYSIFCRQFVSIISAGVSIINALEMMRDQTENRTLKKALGEVYEDVSKGESMAGAMKKHSKVFPSMLCNMVEAGEASGSMEVAFERMAVQFEKENKLKQSVKKAMIYPIVLLVVMVGVLFLMMIWVIPNFMGMFAELDTELPPITQAVVNMSDFVIAKWWLILLVVAAAIALFKAYAASPSGKFVLGGIALKIPVFGKLQTKSECARLGRTLCTLLGAGVPMMDAIEITGRSMENVHYKKAMMDAKDQVMRGMALSRPLKTCGLFPPMVVHMVSIGEETGNIETMLENVANYYEDDVQVATEQVMALMEPMIIVVMAIVVGVLIMAIMQPMLTLYESIG
ncbi:type II secretion system F family protein [Suilimivivens sp.]|uniref:type II secretion system F family protein n=1 Tax=Suilimivivens sp. TaxID=2981669 RepID=UPI00307749E5